MNKHIPTLYKFAIAAIFLTMAGCKKKTPDIHYYQQYWVSYYKTQNSYDATAMFSVDNPKGQRILLDNNTPVKLNNMEPWVSNGDCATYRWNGNGTPDVEFSLKELSSEIYYNSFRKSAMPDVEIEHVDSVVSKAVGCTVVISGGPIIDTAVESGTVSVFGSTGSSGAAFTSDTIYLTPYRLQSLSPGKITVVVSRTRKMPVASSDGAGGRMSMTINVEKDIMLTE